jgi:hypothetical protein
MKKQEIINTDLLYNEGEIGGEVALWRAVIIQSLADLKLPTTNKKYRSWLRQAIKWFNDADSDFYMVCELANIQAHSVLQQAHHLIVSREKL